ncbi:galectin-4-like [Anopheles cruzii]|uniref:galectin-4-like n=1 Tax=Anopheles cruzii TaxID=68878 RepID=UPI0022EC7B66|nr:galectin-4-like [Anopheles cruzii]
MSNVQIFTPILPYVGQLPGELRYGSRIKLRGHFREPQDTVHIILQQETLLNPNTDVPLYITLNPGRHEIVRHRLCSKNCSHGQNEERAINCPIAYGQDFELSIVPTGAGFEIGLHGTPVHTFAHHLPPAAAHYLFVSSGCVIFAITFENWSGERPYGLPQPSAPPLQLPRLYPTMEQPVAPQHQQPKYPVQQTHQQTHHQNLLQELILQVLPLMQLAAAHSPSANSHAVTSETMPLDMLASERGLEQGNTASCFMGKNHCVP